MNTTLSAYIKSSPAIKHGQEGGISQSQVSKENYLVSPDGDSATLPLPISFSLPLPFLIFGAAIFLVSVPVFVEAPLVRNLPWLSLSLTGFWLWLSLNLMSRSSTYLWGDLLFGFTWSWFAGAIYWGWLRWEPLWHLPVEAIALPFAVWCLRRNWGKVGNWFYLGSLFGTVLTDIYFYLVNLIPYWREVMQVEPEEAFPILQNALTQVHTPWGGAWAIVLMVVLLTVGIVPLSKKQPHWYAFSGAVLSTILVDMLFLVAAAIA
ncbi:hypothetical protein Cal6303_4654 [Calothrix sp. PCC 6303]|nr:hypothetical protein Cal6303_4654 [Calothrix sp. PCC 6303]